MSRTEERDDQEFRESAGARRWCRSRSSPCSPRRRRSPPAPTRRWPTDRPGQSHRRRRAGGADRPRLLPGQQALALRPGLLHPLPAAGCGLLRRPDPGRSGPGHAHRSGHQRPVSRLHHRRRQLPQRRGLRRLGRHDHRPGRRARSRQRGRRCRAPRPAGNTGLLRPHGRRFGLRPLGRRAGGEGRHRRRGADERRAQPDLPVRRQFRAGLRAGLAGPRPASRTGSIERRSGSPTV